MQFPLFKTKIEGLEKKFNLIDPKEQKEYFELKAGKEVAGAILQYSTSIRIK